MTFNPNFPLNSTKIRDTPGQMQTNWTTIQTGDVSFIPQVVNFDDRSIAHVPAIPIDPVANADTLRLYNKEDGNNREQLYVIDENSEKIQLTRFGNQLPFVWASAIIPDPSILSTVSGTPTPLTITNGLASAWRGTVGSDANIVTVLFDTLRQPPNANYVVLANTAVSRPDDVFNRVLNLHKGSATTIQFSLRMQNTDNNSNLLDVPFHIAVIGLFTL